MIACDLDGTLLRSDNSISDFTKDILSRCRRKGIKVVYATGRGGSSEIRAPSFMFDGRINMNGAIGKIGDEIIYSKTIPWQSARPLLTACDKYGLKTASELCGIHYSNFNVAQEWSIITSYKIVDFSKHEIDAEKLYMLVKKPEDAAFIEKYLNNDLYLTVSRDGMAQVMHKDASKSKALDALAKFWNIGSSETAAFGDDLNDIDMIRYAGAGVAMENAVSEVKAAADFECKNNNEDGIAKWLCENIL
ncbi:MAG: HAD family hydrolase [Treponema sp.]|nr:HAD family hydrolase [Treponema sp.]